MKKIETEVAQLVTDDPYYAFTQIVILMYGHRQHKSCGISCKASIAESAEIGADSHIHDYAVVEENAKVGARCILYPGGFCR